MYKRTPDVVESLLARAGYGLGYSEDEAQPVDALTASATPAAKAVPESVDLGALPLRVGRDQRLQVWYELGEDAVERWDHWKARRQVSMARRWQTWTDDLRGHAGELRDLTDRSRSQGRQLWSTWHSRVSTWRQSRRSEPQPELKPESGRVLLDIQMPIQRDRNWKVLQRVSLDERQRSGVEGQSPVTDSTGDTRASEVFADVWSIGETAGVDTQNAQEAQDEVRAEAPTPEETETPAVDVTEAEVPAVERLRRMLASEQTVSAASDDSAAQST